MGKAEKRASLKDRADARHPVCAHIHPHEQHFQEGISGLQPTLGRARQHLSKKQNHI